MIDSLRNRLLLAFGVAVVAALGITVVFSETGQMAEKVGKDAFVVWKSRTGVDLATLPLQQTVSDALTPSVSTRSVIRPSFDRPGLTEASGSPRVPRTVSAPPRRGPAPRVGKRRLYTDLDR